MSPSSLHARRYIAFVHIEKAAGTTFIHLLRRNYFLRYLDVRPYSPKSNAVFTARDLELSLRVNPWLHAFGGHAVQPHGDLSEVFQNVQFVTIFRDPVKRYISQFLYANAVLNLNITFDQFLSDERTHNFQTRKIAGQADLELAKRILEDRFLAFGLVEQFDEFLELLSVRLEPKRFNRAYETRNTGSSPKVEAELLSLHGSAIRDVNRIDAALYRHVQKLLEPINCASTGRSRAVSEMKFRDRMKYYVDGALRKTYFEPATGLLRICNGMRMKGSY